MEKDKSFGFALEMLKEGATVAREIWCNSEGEDYIFMADNLEADSQLYITYWSEEYGVFKPGWVPSQEDMFFEDWVILERG